MSIEAEQYLRLKNKIYSDLNAKTFSINHWHRLVEIPVEIGLLQQLEKLFIIRTPSLKVFPKTIAELSHLEVLSLGFNNLKQLPTVLGELHSLKVLTLSNNRFSTTSKWSLLAQLPVLHQLNLSYSLQNMSSLPTALCSIHSLIELNLVGNGLKELPKEMAQLQNLERLYLDKNNFDNFPTVVTLLPKLQELQIPAKALEQLPDDVLKLQHIPKLVFTAKNTYKTPFIYEFERFLKNIPLYAFDKTFQRFFLSIIRQEKTIAQLKNKELFFLLNSASSIYMNQALNEIEDRIKKSLFGTFRYPKAGDKVVIKGKIKGKVSELKARLAHNHIQTGVKINASTTHVLMANMPNTIQEIPLDGSVVIITEQLLVGYLNEVEQPYLLAEPEAHNLEQIRNLLHSDSNENILMALELIKGGGMPMELVTDLFLIYKFHKEQKIKRIIRQIIGQYCPLTFVTALKNRKSIGRFVSETTRRQNLEFYCQAGDLNKLQIALYLLNKGINTHSFVLFNLTIEGKIAYFMQVIKEGYLSLSNLDLTELPKDIIQIPNLKHLDLSHNRFSTVPTALFECKELETLYIRGLYEIQEKPKDLWKINSLKVIHVGYYNQWMGKSNSITKSITIDGKTVIGSL